MKKTKQQTRWNLKEPFQIDKKDKRYKKYMTQIKQRGFDDSEMWNLDHVIAEFILPRLTYFRATTHSIPPAVGTLGHWQELLDKMIFAFQFKVMAFSKYQKMSTKQKERAEDKAAEGLRLFTEYFHDLWQ